MKKIVILSRIGETTAIKIFRNRLAEHDYNVVIDTRLSSFINYESLVDDEIYGIKNLYIIVFLTKNMIGGVGGKRENYINELLVALKNQFDKILPIIVNERIFENIDYDGVFVDSTSTLNISSVVSQAVNFFSKSSDNLTLVTSKFDEKLSGLIKLKIESRNSFQDFAVIEKELEQAEELYIRIRSILTDIIEPCIMMYNVKLKDIDIRLRLNTDIYEKEHLNTLNYNRKREKSVNSNRNDIKLPMIRYFIIVKAIPNNVVNSIRSEGLMFEFYNKKTVMRVAVENTEDEGEKYEIDEVSIDVIESEIISYLKKIINSI